MLWIVTMFLVTIGAMVIAGIEILHNQPINPFVQSILGAATIHAATVGGGIISTQAAQTGAQVSSTATAVAAQTTPTTVVKESV